MQIAQQEYDYLHRLNKIFVQMTDGAEILKTWEHFTFYEPGIKKGDPEYTIFVSEGEKLFVRKILIALKRFEALPAPASLEIVDAQDLTSPSPQL